MNESGLLNILSLQAMNYPYLNDFCNRYLEYPSVIFTPTILVALDEELDRNTYLVHECLTYMDTIALLSIAEYGNANTFTEYVIEGLVRNKTAVNHNAVLGKKIMDDILFTTENDIHNLLRDNISILAIYIFMLVKQLYFIGKGGVNE